MSAALGLAWGVLLAWPLLRPTRRRAVAVRARGEGRARPAAGRLRHLARAAAATAPASFAARVLRGRRERREASRERRELPVVTDLLGVAVGAGATPAIALDLAQRWAPPRSTVVLAAVSRARRDGLGIAAALEVATAHDEMWAPIVDALLAGERLGAPIGAALGRVAEMQRSDLRRAAEAHARRVPVRLLFPLVFLVLPAFGLLTVVPVLLSGITAL